MHIYVQYIYFLTTNNMVFITQEGLKQLGNYKYKPGGYTWLDTKMNYFWQWTVNLVPKWVAPNLITFIGWLFVIASYVNMLRYDYTFKKDLPSSAFYFAAACIFIYSTLDAIDGKQARRTKSSSPLGQLFDHGCDSFSITFFMLAICQALKLEASSVFMIYIACQASFWVSNWSQYNTGVLRTKVGQFGVTEGEFTCMFIHILTGIFGQGIWTTSILGLAPFLGSLATIHPLINTFLNLKLSLILIYFYAGLLISVSVYITLKTILDSDKKKQCTFEFLSFFVLILMEVSWSKMKIYQTYNGVILVNFGIIASLMVCKMIICSVTNMKFQYFHPELIPLICTSIVLAILDLMQTSVETITIVFVLCMLTNLFIIFNFLYSTINQITDFLGIYCFSISKKRVLKQN